MANKVVLPIKGAYITKKSDTKDTKKSSKKKKTSSNKSKATETASKMTSTEKAKHKSVTLPGKKSTSSALSTNAITGNSFKSEKNSFGDTKTVSFKGASTEQNKKLSDYSIDKGGTTKQIKKDYNDKVSAKKAKEAAEKKAEADYKKKLAAGVSQEEEDKYAFNTGEVTKKLAITGRGSDAVRKEQERNKKDYKQGLETAKQEAETKVKTEIETMGNQVIKEAEAEANTCYQQYLNGKISYEEYKSKVEDIKAEAETKYETGANKLSENYGTYAQANMEHEAAAYGKSRTKFQNALTSGIESVKEGGLLLANGLAQSLALTVAQQYNPDKKGGAIASGRTGRVLPYGGYTKEQLESPIGNAVKGIDAISKEEKLRQISNDIIDWAQNNALAKLTQDISLNRSLMDTSMIGANKKINDVISQTAMNVPSMVVSMVNPYLGLGLFGMSAMGLSAMSAYDSGATIQDAVTYGMLSGMVEMGTEKIFPAVGGAFGKTASSSLWHGLVGNATRGKVYRIFTEETMKSLKDFSETVSGKILKCVLEGGGEVTEEMIAEIIDPYLQRATFNPKADPATFEEIKEAGLMGLAVSAVLGVPVSTMSISNQVRTNKAIKSMDIAKLDMLMRREQTKAQIKVARGKISYDEYLSEVERIDEKYNELSSKAGLIKARTRKTEEKVYNNESIVEENQAEETANNLALNAEDGTEVSVITHNNGEFARNTYKVVNGSVDVNSVNKTALTNAEAKSVSQRYADMNNTENSARSTGATYGVREDVVKLAEQMQDKTGAKVVFFDGEEGQNGNIKGNTVYININSKNVSAQILAHEFTHLIESNSEESYQTMLDAVKEFYGDSYKQYAEEIRRVYASYKDNLSTKNIKGKKHSQLDDEIIATFVEQKLLTNAQAIERFTDINRSNSEKVIDFINDTITKAAGNKEQKALVKIRKLWQQAYSEAVDKVRSKDTSSKESAAESTIRNSFNTKTLDYAITVTCVDEKKKAELRKVKYVFGELAKIQSAFNKKKTLDTIHKINKYLHTEEGMEVWKKLIALQDYLNGKTSMIDAPKNVRDYENENGPIVIPVDFVTTDTNQETINVEGKEVTSGLKGIAIEYVDSDTGKVSKFAAFKRSVPQIVFDNMDPSERELIRREIILAVEDAYRSKSDKGIELLLDSPIVGLDIAIPSASKINSVLNFTSPKALESKNYKGVQAPIRAAEKTLAALNLNSACPMFTIGNNGCYLDACYLTQMANGATGVNLFKSAFYGGELLQLSDKFIEMINEKGGLRINGLGDTIDENLAQLKDVFRHAEIRGLKLKIITKQENTFKVVEDYSKDNGVGGQGDISNIVVQPSLDFLWIPVELDDVYGAGMRGITKLTKNLDDPKKAEKLSQIYKEVGGREVMILNGKAYRKYGFTEEQIAGLREKYPDVQVLPRYVVCTAEEISALAYNGGIRLTEDVTKLEYFGKESINLGYLIQTLMHGKVPDGCISQFGGEVINFGGVRHVIEKDKNGEWHFYGEAVGDMTLGRIVDIYSKYDTDKEREAALKEYAGKYKPKDPNTINAYDSFMALGKTFEDFYNEYKAAVDKIKETTKDTSKQNQKIARLKKKRLTNEKGKPVSIVKHEVGNSTPHQKVMDYVKEHYTKEQQDIIWNNLKLQMCCQTNDFKDACAGCSSLCGRGGLGYNAIKPIDEKSKEIIDSFKNPIDFFKFAANADAYWEKTLKGKVTNDTVRNSRDIPTVQWDDSVENAIFIKNTGEHFVDKILSGEKTIETRTERSKIKNLIGKKVGIINTEKGMIVGYATIGKPVTYTSDNFHNEENQSKHLVPNNSEFDIKDGETKLGYPLNNVEKLDKPVKAPKGDGIRIASYINIKDGTRYSRDTEYFAAIENGDMETVQRMVDEAALEWGAVSKEGKPIHLYHGTPNFGWTTYKDPVNETPFIYTSTSRNVSANYAGDNNYAGVKQIGRKYRGGDDIRDIIVDAESEWNTKYHIATIEDRRKVLNSIADRIDDAEEKLTKLKPDYYGKDWFDIEIENAINWVENILFINYYDVNLRNFYDSDKTIFNVNIIDDETREYTRESIANDVERFSDNIGKIREFYDENYDNMSDEVRNYFSYLIGYEVGDIAIDVEYGVQTAILDEDIIANDYTGKLANPRTLRKVLEKIHNIGSYQLYGKLGDRPFIFDANKSQFWSIKVPEIDDKYHGTDWICRWALEHGYTSIVMKNIYDYGELADNYVFFNPNQIKSADPITYDDNGEIILPSERFNQNKDDIRWSRDVNSGIDIASANPKIIDEIASLEKRGAYAKALSTLNKYKQESGIAQQEAERNKQLEDADRRYSFNTDNPAKLLSLFSGIGAFEKAFRNIGLPFEVVGYCEKDNQAAKVYSKLHNVDEAKNIGDIKNVDINNLPEADIITNGFPCVDFSPVGSRNGMYDVDGNLTDSGLVIHALRIIEAVQPKLVISENSDKLMSKKFAKERKYILDALDQAGYNSYIKVLDAQDYGIPQHRERTIIVSIRKDIKLDYEFPTARERTSNIWDYIGENPKGNQGQIYRDKDYVALHSAKKSHKMRVLDKQNNPDASAFTITASAKGDRDDDTYINDGIGVRGLTTEERWKLMGFTDDDLNIAKSVSKKSQLQKQSGNSIVVPLAEDLAKSIFYTDNEALSVDTKRYSRDTEKTKIPKQIRDDIKTFGEKLKAVSYNRSRIDNKIMKNKLNKIIESIVLTGSYMPSEVDELIDFIYDTGYQNVKDEFRLVKPWNRGTVIWIDEEFHGEMESFDNLRTLNRKLYPYGLSFTYNRNKSKYNLFDAYSDFLSVNPQFDEGDFAIYEPTDMVNNIIGAYIGNIGRKSLRELDSELETETNSFEYEEFSYKNEIRKALYDMLDVITVDSIDNLLTEAKKRGEKVSEGKGFDKGIEKGIKQAKKEQRNTDESTLKEFDKMLRSKQKEEREAAEEVLKIANRIISDVRKEERELTKAEMNSLRKQVVADKDMVIKALRTINKDLRTEAARKERERITAEREALGIHDTAVSDKNKEIEKNKKISEKTESLARKIGREEHKNEMSKRQLRMNALIMAKKESEKQNPVLQMLARSKAQSSIDRLRTDVFNYFIQNNLWKAEERNGRIVLLDESNNRIAEFKTNKGVYEFTHYTDYFVPDAGLSYLAREAGLDVGEFFTMFSDIKKIKAGKGKIKQDVYSYINMLNISVEQKVFLYEFVGGYSIFDAPPFLPGGKFKPIKGNKKGRMMEVFDRISIALFDGTTEPTSEDIEEFIDTALPHATKKQREAFKEYFGMRMLDVSQEITEARMDEQTKLAIEEETTNPILRDKFKKIGQGLYRDIFADGYAIEGLASKTGNRLLVARYYEAVKSSSIALRMINEKFQEDITGKAMGKSLYEIFKPIFNIKDGGKTLQNLTDYCNYRHDINRWEYDKEYTGLTPNELKAKIEEIEKRYEKNGKNIIKETADAIVGYSRNLLWYNVQAGRISEETYNFFVERYPNYVPTYRVQEETYIDRKGKTRVRDKKIIKEAKGGTETVLPLYIQLSMRTREMVAAAKRNQLAFELLRSTKNPKATEYINGLVKTDEQSSAEELWGADDKGQITSLRGEDSFIPVYINGERCKLDVVDQDILYGWDTINLPLNSGLFLDLLKKCNDIRRGLLTQYNLTFWATNMPKDISEMIMLNPHAQRNAKYLPIAIATIFNTGTQMNQSKYAKGKFNKGRGKRKQGIKNGVSAYNADREYSLTEEERGYYQFLWDTYMSKGASQSSIFEYTDFSPRGDIKGAKGKIKKVGSIPFNGLDAFNFMVEQTPRFAVFLENVDRLKKEREKGENKYSDDEIYSIAAYQATDATVNFSRSGRVTRYLNTYGFTFLNAGIQGFDKVVRGFKNLKGDTAKKTALNILGLYAKFIALGMGVGLLQEWLYGALGGDDDSDDILKLLYGDKYKKVKEEYANLPDYIRYGYLCFYVGDRFISIPRGRLVSAINTATLSIRDIAWKNKTPYQGIVSAASSFSSNVLPQTPLNGGLFQPFLDLQRNKDHWLNPIVSEWENKGKGFHYLEYDEETSRLAINIAYGLHYLTGTLLGDEQAVIDLSPMKIDYLVEQYAGSYKDFVKAILGGNIKDDMITAAYNLAKKFVFTQTEKDRSASDYYEFKERAENIASANDGESPYAPLTTLFNQYQDSISAFKDEIKAIEDDPNMSWSEKREKTLKLKEQLNDLYREALSDAKQLYQYSYDTYSGKDDNSRIAEEWIAQNKSPEWQFERLTESELELYQGSGLDKSTFVTALNAKNSFVSTDTVSKQDQFVAWLEYQDYSKAQKEQIYGAFYSTKNGYPVEFTEGSNGNSSLDLALAGDEGWEAAKASGISITTYTHLMNKMGDFHSDYDENGNETKAKREYVAEYLNSLNISASEKALLWKTACGYKKDSPISFSNGGSVEVPGSMTSPLLSTGRLSSPYGYNVDKYHAGRLHDGVDIAISVGTPALACTDAEVTRVYSSSSGYGNYVEYKITSGKYKGYSVFYGHLSSIGVSKGDTISAGQIIAETGNTGRSTGPHIHIGAKDPDGNSIDPRKILDIEGAGTASNTSYTATVSGGGNSYSSSGGNSSKSTKTTTNTTNKISANKTYLPTYSASNSVALSGYDTSSNYVPSSSGTTPTGRGMASASFGTAGTNLPKTNSVTLPTYSKSTTAKRTQRTSTSFS